MDERLKEKIIETESRSKSNTKRIDEQEKSIEELKKTYSIMQNIDYRMGKVENSVDQINQKLDSTQKEKGLKWDKLLEYLFYAILAFVLWKIGLKV